jgi:hypothetical protein
VSLIVNGKQDGAMAAYAHDGSTPEGYLPGDSLVQLGEDGVIPGYVVRSSGVDVLGGIGVAR